MSEQFFYIQLTFIPKEEIRAVLTPAKRQVIVEVVKNPGSGRKSEIVDENLNKVLALDLARKAALGTFPTMERDIGLYEEEPPAWLNERIKVMNERPCDHEENGARAWRLH